LEIKKATRKGIAPLIALYSESGCGKTYSSLLLARGLVGPAGRIIMIETEGGRGELYADVEIIGGYEVLRLEEPFSPARYIEAIGMSEKAGADVIIVDSGSHQWEGVGGVLDMAATNEEKSGKSGLHNWKTPKFEHAKFLQALTRAKIPVIVCLRAKYKTRQGKDKGKTVIVKDDHTSPIQAEDFIFEATCHMEILPDHKLRLTKWSHPKLKPCFPVNAPITIETGRLIQEWCQSPGGSPKEPTPETSKQPAPAQNEKKADPNPASDVKTLKTKLWTLTKHIHLGEKSVFSKWLRDKKILNDKEKLESLIAPRLEEVIDMAEITINEGRENDG